MACRVAKNVVADGAALARPINKFDGSQLSVSQRLDQVRQHILDRPLRRIDSGDVELAFGWNRRRLGDRQIE